MATKMTLGIKTMINYIFCKIGIHHWSSWSADFSKRGRPLWTKYCHRCGKDHIEYEFFKEPGEKS